jgi:hypothetical protein
VLFSAVCLIIIAIAVASPEDQVVPETDFKAHDTLQLVQDQAVVEKSKTCPGGLGSRKGFSGWTCTGNGYGSHHERKVKGYCKSQRWKKDVLDCCPEQCKPCPGGLGSRKGFSGWTCTGNGHGSHHERKVKGYCTHSRWKKDVLACCSKQCKKAKKKRKAKKIAKKVAAKRGCKCRGREMAVDATTAAFLDAMTTPADGTAQLVQVLASTELETKLVQAQAPLKGTTCEQRNSSSGKKWCTVSSSCKAATGVVNNVKIKGKCIPFCQPAGFKVPAKMTIC